MDNDNLVLMVMYGKGMGGAELQFIELANYLSHRCNITLLVLGGDEAIKREKLNERISVNVISYGRFPCFFIPMMKAVVVGISGGKKHIITTSFIGNFIGFLVSFFSKKKLISMQTVAKSMNYPALDRFVLSNFDLLIAGAKDIKKYLIGHGQDKRRIHVVYNWVDFSRRDIYCEEPSVLRESLNISDGTVVIGCVGRLHSQKGQGFLIKAFSDVVKKFPNTVLVLVGDGPSKGSLLDMVIELGLGDKVIFIGTITGRKYNDIFRIFDIYIQPSIFEGLPRTLLDAMYMGLPIIATNVNGNCEAIENNVNGLLVSPKSSDELYVSILRFLDCPKESRTMAFMAKKRSLDFSMSKQLSAIEQLVFSVENVKC